jgi:hypothetical protein
MADILRLSIGVQNWVSLLKNLSGLGIGLPMKIATQADCVETSF